MAASSQFICALGRIIEKVEKIRKGRFSVAEFPLLFPRKMI